MRLRHARAVLAALAAPATLALSQQPNTAWESPVGTIGMNQQVRGTLTGASTLFQNTPAHFWWFACATGQTFQFDAIAVWDTYAIVTDPNGKIVARDDDGSGESNARVIYTCASTGNYRLGITTQNASGEVGEYRLVVRNPQQGPLAGGPTVGTPQPLPGDQYRSPIAGLRPVPIGRLSNYDVKTATLPPGRQLDTWIWQCEPVREVTFTAKPDTSKSPDWDISLFLFDGTGRELTRRDRQNNANETHVVHPCMDNQLITVGVASPRSTGGAYSLHAQARTYTPPLGAIPVPVGSGARNSYCPELSHAVCTDQRSGLRWSHAEGGAMPVQAFAAGLWSHAGADQPMAVCRAYFALADARSGDWQVLPGKISKGLAGCYVGVNGDEVIAASYEVLVHFVPVPAGDPLGDARFVAASGGGLPPRPVEAGMGASPQYVCLVAMPNDGVHVGRIAANGQGCSVAWAGKEVIAKEYQVLARP